MFKPIKNFFPKHKRLSIFVVVLVLVLTFAFLHLRSKQSTPTYQTTAVEKGTLISTITASGTIIATNNIDVTSTANGQIAKVYVKEGDKVTKGQKLFDVTLDATGLQKQAQAYASFLSAQNNLNQAKASYYTLQAASFSANQKFVNDAVARNLDTNDPTYIQENAAWLAAEINFNNVQNSISAAQANLTNASLTYQQASSTIKAPISGIIENITIVPGMAITNSTTSSTSSSTSSTTVASIRTDGNPVATINVAEIDVAKVHQGQKVTLIFDSIPDTTFTGIIAGINKLGTSSSGITSYPATIQFDTSSDKILPSMSVTASIIISVKDNILLVPSSSIITQNGQTMVRELKNGQLTLIPITKGDGSDSQTEIVEGVSEGDIVVTAIINSTQTSTTTNTSPFSGTNRSFGTGGFGNNTRNIQTITR